jgi:hypothetical protein
MNKPKLVMLLLFQSIIFSAASEAQSTKEKLDNVSLDLITCASFFTTMSTALTLSGEDDIAATYTAVSNTAFKYSFYAAKQFRSEEMAKKLTLSRFELSLADMRKKIGGDVSNTSILINDYMEDCEEALSNIPKLIEYLKSNANAPE